MDTKEEVNQEVARLIRKARTEQNLRQSDVAYMLGITPTQVKNYESGDYNVYIYRLYQIARVLECNIMDVLPLSFSGDKGKIIEKMKRELVSVKTEI